MTTNMLIKFQLIYVKGILELENQHMVTFIVIIYANIINRYRNW